MFYIFYKKYTKFDNFLIFPAFPWLQILSNLHKLISNLILSHNSKNIHKTQNKDTFKLKNKKSEASLGLFHLIFRLHHVTINNRFPARPGSIDYSLFGGVLHGVVVGGCGVLRRLRCLRALHGPGRYAHSCLLRCLLNMRVFPGASHPLILRFTHAASAASVEVMNLPHTTHIQGLHYLSRDHLNNKQDIHINQSQFYME